MPANTLKGAATGLAIGFVFCRSFRSRYMLMLYGASFGFGLCLDSAYKNFRYMNELSTGKEFC